MEERQGDQTPSLSAGQQDQIVNISVFGRAGRGGGGQEARQSKYSHRIVFLIFKTIKKFWGCTKLSGTRFGLQAVVCPPPGVAEEARIHLQDY